MVNLWIGYKNRKTGLTLLLLWSIALSLIGQQSIEQIKLLPSGSVVTTTGTIISGPEFGQIRYMQDAHAGIAIFSSSLSSTTPGDSIVITGVLSRYRGELQLSPVMSFQLVGSGKNITRVEADHLHDLSFPSFESRKVFIKCAGVASCESFFEEGWYRMYDENGIVARLWVDTDIGINGFEFSNKSLALEGIWTRFEDQYQLRCQGISPANEETCFLIPEGHVSFDYGSPGILWNSPNDGMVEIQFGTTDFSSSVFINGAHPYVLFDFKDLPPNNIYQARLAKPIPAGGNSYSIPSLFSVPASESYPVEILFNRSIDSSFSDGSHPLATGSTAIEADIIQRIDQAMFSLDVSMYNTTRATIVQALSRAVQRGVEVRYMADDETSNAALEGSLPFEVRYRSGGGIMHNKFIVADPYVNPWLWTGSTNFSANQLSTDPNHAVVIRDAGLVLNYLREFVEMWGQSAQQPDARYGDFKVDNTIHLFKIGALEIESYFSPSDETNCHLIKALQSADYHVEIGLLLLTKEDIVDEVIALHQSGVQVRIIVEDEQSSASALARLREANIPIAVHSPGPIFHHKYAIIDEGFPASDPQVISGSHNWTWSADHINDENTLIFHSQSIANIFRQEFEARWAELNSTSAVLLSEPGLEIYPNPSSDFVCIHNYSPSPFSIILYDACLRPLRSLKLSSHESVSLYFEDQLPSGIYTIRLTNDVYQVARRIVVERR